MAINLKLIQKGQSTIAASANAVQLTIPTTIVLGKAFLTFTWSASNLQTPEGGLVRGRFLDASNMRFERNASPSESITIEWTIVEYTAGSNITVEELFLGTAGNGTTLAITDIGAIGNGFVVASWENNGLIADGDDFCFPEITSATQITIRMQTGTIDQMTLFVVSSTDPGFSVQIAQTTDGTTGASPQSGNITTAVDQGRTILRSYSKDNAGSADFGWLGTVEFFDNDTIEWFFGDTSAKTFYAYVIEWPTNWEAHWQFNFGTGNVITITIANNPIVIADSFLFDGSGNGISNARVPTEFVDNYGVVCMRATFTTTTITATRGANFGREANFTPFILEQTSVAPEGGAAGNNNLRGNLKGDLIGGFQ